MLGNGIGRREDEQTGSLIQVFANASNISHKVGGTTFDWNTVTPLAANETLADGTVIKAGTRRIRHGMFIARITAAGPKLGWYGLYDASANDGRQLRVAGQVFFINSTVLVDDDLSLHPAGYDGGTVYEARMAISSANPTPPGFMSRSEMLAAFPLLRLVSTTV